MREKSHFREEQNSGKIKLMLLHHEQLEETKFQHNIRKYQQTHIITSQSKQNHIPHFSAAVLRTMLRKAESSQQTFSA